MFIVTLKNGRQMRYSALDGCKDVDVITWRLERQGWKIAGVVPA